MYFLVEIKISFTFLAPKERKNMYVCLTCKSTFYAPKVYYEAHSFENPPYELFRECPICSSTYIEEGNCKKDTDDEE